jgi:hypothetical protein
MEGLDAQDRHDRHADGLALLAVVYLRRLQDKL